MKLSDALVCCDCDELVPIGTLACPSCTCTVFLPLTQAIEPLHSREEINLCRWIWSVS